VIVDHDPVMMRRNNKLCGAKWRGVGPNFALARGGLPLRKNCEFFKRPYLWIDGYHWAEGGKAEPGAKAGLGAAKLVLGGAIIV
jgi:hypothetical protein